MISPPRMAKINSDAVARHYSEVAAAVDLPIIVQDYPPISGYAMEPSLLARIARDVPAARTIKLEDPPTPFKTSRILEQTKGIDVAIFGGLGGVFLLEELLAGAAGAMTGFAFPKMLVQIVALFRAGNVDEAADDVLPPVPLMRFEFQEGIGMAIRKEVLKRRGALAHAGIRPPGGALDQTTRDALDRVMNWTGRRRRFVVESVQMDLGLKQSRDGGRREQRARLRRGACAGRGRRARVDCLARQGRDRQARRRRLRRQPARTVLGVPAELSSADAIASWHKATLDRFGGVDLLFANTGGPPAGPAAQFRR